MQSPGLFEKYGAFFVKRFFRIDNKEISVPMRNRLGKLIAGCTEAAGIRPCVTAGCPAGSMPQ